MSLSIEEIRKNYSQFPDYKIVQIAEQDSHSLPPEVVTILLEEVKKRGLNKNLNESVHIQQAPLSEEKFVELKQAILYAPCPSCGSRKAPLMALKLVETIGLIFVAQHTTRFFIACPTCNKKEIKRTMLKTAILGWWSPQTFIYYTPKALIQSYSNFNKSTEQSNALLEVFILAKLGEIQAVVDKPLQLSKLLKRHNINGDQI